MHIRIAEKIIKEVARRFHDERTKEKVGRKQIGADLALRELNAIMLKYQLPTFREDAHSQTLKLNKFFTGDDLNSIEDKVAPLLKDLRGSEADLNTWTSFTTAMNLAKTWEKGNGLFEVDIGTKKELRKACGVFFNNFKNNPTFRGKITPYVHIFCSHVPDLLDKTLNLQRFTQQGAEHWMGFLQRLFLAQTNHQISATINSSNAVMTNSLVRLFKMSTCLMVLPKKYPTPLARKKTRSDKGSHRKGKVSKAYPPVRVTRSRGQRR